MLTLSSYALVALRRDHGAAIEAAMKYFVLGAMASGFLLYGMSMLYGATGSLDINADVGESYGRWSLGSDAALMPYLSSANVACGFHAGDPTTIRFTLAAAVAHGVAVGAHVGYADLRGFGRRAIDIAPADLEADVLFQLGALEALTRAAGATVTYLKPHGALYHRTLDDSAQASAVIAAITAFGRTLPVMTMDEGELAEAARAAGLPVIREGYADRAMGADGRLIPRDQPGAVLTDAHAIAAQALRLAGNPNIDSVCLHGDTPGAVTAAAAVREAVDSAGYVVRSAGAGS